MLFLGSFIVAHADELLVGGVTVDLTRSGYVTGTNIQGTVYYEANERMLKLTNATITTDMIGIAADVSRGSSLDFRVYLSSKNTINSGRVSVRADKNILFCGNGDLKLNGPGNFINKCKMTVYACRVTVNSTANDAFHSMDNGNADLELAYHGALKATCKETVLKNFNDIKYSTGKLLSGSPTGTEMMIGKDYELKIGGIKVTPFNRDEVSGPNIEGKVSVSFVDNYSGVKISLNNAKISNSNYGIDYNNQEKDITLALTGENSITATTRGLTGWTGRDCGAYNIEGKGSDKLTIQSHTGISHQGNLKVKDCVLDIKASALGIDLWNYGKLTADNATLHAKTTKENGAAIGNLTGVTYLNGCTETKPLRAGYDQRNNSISAGSSDPNVMLSEVTIEPTYGVIVCGHILKKSMGTETFSITDEDISGKVMYDPSQNCLILSDGATLGIVGEFKTDPATIEVLKVNRDVYSDAKPFIIYSDGNSTNTINDNVKGGSGNAIFSYNDIVITGDAPLDVYSQFGISFFGNHYLHISLKADFSDYSFSKAVGSVSSPDDYFTLGLNPEENATYTYRFKSEISPVFEQLAVLDKPDKFTVIAPFNATYDDMEKAVVAEGQSVINEWVVFGFPCAEGYMCIADTDPFVKNQRIYPYMNLNFSVWCQQFYETWKKEKHDIIHIYKTKEEAVNSTYTHELNWDGKVPLTRVLALHGNLNGDNDVSIDTQYKIYTWKFELVDYNSTALSYGSGADQYAWLDGDVLKACSITTDGKRDPDHQSRRSIGQEPLLKVQVFDVYGELVTGGYIKFRIGDVRDDYEVKVSLSEAEKVSSGTGTEYRFKFYELEEKALDAMRDEHISKAEFETNYCFAQDPSSPFDYFETPLREYNSFGNNVVIKPIQCYAKYGGMWIKSGLHSILENINDTNRLGTFQMTISGDDNYFGWTLTDSQREKMGYEKVAVRLYDPYLTFHDVYLVFSVNDSPKGDINLDGVVDVADVATVIDAMASGIYDSNYDVNGDGVVDVADIATIIDLMAGQ